MGSLSAPLGLWPDRDGIGEGWRYFSRILIQGKGSRVGIILGKVCVAPIRCLAQATRALRVGAHDPGEALCLQPNRQCHVGCRRAQ